MFEPSRLLIVIADPRDHVLELADQTIKPPKYAARLQTQPFRAGLGGAVWWALISRSDVMGPHDHTRCAILQ
jgi:hypothetical protein